MTSELDLPTVPEARPNDAEDVSWSLSTAEAMWARGDHAEGIKWVRKAAEAAADADDDARALELAKAASDLASALARLSEPETPDAAEAPSSDTPDTSRSGPPPVAEETPGRTPIQPSAPPPAAPRPLRVSQAPAAPRPTFGSPSRPPRPLSVQPPAPIEVSEAPAKPEPAPKKGRRRSRESLEQEARDAGLSPERETARDLQAKTTEVAAVSPRAETAAPRGRAKSRPDSKPPASSRTAEWDHSPTQAMSGEELDKLDGDRMTSLAGAPPPRSMPRTPAKTVHDQDIRTSQAVRVVVWRDAAGVHVAPEGTVVSAISIDAVLVALDPAADLTAWLSQRSR